MRSMWILAAGAVVLAACGDNGGNVTQPPGNTPPVANFGVTCSGLTCAFSDSSHDAEGAIQAWKWDFGDGNSSTDQNPTHDYATAQAYNATLTVTDAGSHVSDAVLQRRFDPFFTKKSGGLGMGLEISKTIVEGNRGRIWATRNQGAGITMQVALPKAMVQDAS